VKPRIFGIETEYGPTAKTGPSWGPTSETAFDADNFRHGEFSQTLRRANLRRVCFLDLHIPMRVS